MKVSKNGCSYVLITCMLLFVHELEATKTTSGTEHSTTQKTSPESPETPLVKVQDSGTVQSDQSTIQESNSGAGTSHIESDGTENSKKQQENQNCDTKKEAVDFFRKLFDGSHINVYARDFVDQIQDHYKRTEYIMWTEKVYMANIAFEEGDHPVFLVVGGLNEMEPEGLEVAAWYQLAKKFNALIFFLEHRYYGKSILGIDDLSNENLKYLLSDQTVADVATFIYNSKHSKRRWIVFGKGYGGTIAAWMKMKQPHQVYAAVVYNAPLLAKTENKSYYEFFESEFEVTVKKNIKDAYTEMRSSIKENQYGNFETKFKMCESLDSQNYKDTNVEFMFWSITTYLAEVVKLKHTDPTLFDSVIKTLINEDITNPLDRFGKAIEKILHAVDVPCLAVDYKKALNSYHSTDLDEHKKVYPKSLKFGLGIRQTLWLRCTEYGQFPTSDGTHTFGETISIDFYKKICDYSFDFDFNLNESILRTNSNYGGKNIVARNLLYISHGDKPWNDIGITESNPDIDIVAVKIEAGKPASELLPKYDEIIDNLSRWLTKDTKIVTNKKKEIVTNDEEQKSKAGEVHT